MIERVLARPTVVDVSLAAVAVAYGVVVVVASSDDTALVGSSLLWSLGVVVAGSSALLARRTLPVAVATIVVVARVLFAAAGANEVGPMDIAALMALYTAGRGSTLSVGRGAILAVVTAVAAVVGAALDADDAFGAELVGEVAFLTLPVAVGYGLRQRRERIDQLIDNEATARVQAERLRIARDLHDVVAHRLSTITVQSGVAGHLLDRDPAMTKDALDTINTAGKEALEELRGMVGVLRSTDEPTVAPLQPAPADPDDISALVERARRDGLLVTTTQQGSFPSAVSDGVVIAAHRIIGEALANAARHAGAVPVAVTINHGTNGVTISVDNDRPAGDVFAVPSTGVGIAGMTERAAAVGGSLVAEPTPRGGFTVQADLPYIRQDQ